MNYRIRPVLQLVAALLVGFVGCERSADTTNGAAATQAQDQASAKPAKEPADASAQTDQIPDHALSTTTLAVVPRAVGDTPREGALVAISPEAIGVWRASSAAEPQPQFRLELEQGVVDPGGLKGGEGSLYIQVLHEALDTIESRMRREAMALGEEDSAPPLIIAADAKTTFHLLMQVLYTVGQAGFSELQFLVEEADGEQMRIDYRLPQLKMMADPSSTEPGSPPCALPDIRIDGEGALIYLHQGRAGKSLLSTVQGQAEPSDESDEADDRAEPAWASRALTLAGTDCPASLEQAASGDYFVDVLSSFEAAEFCWSRTPRTGRQLQRWMGGISPGKQVPFEAVAAAMTAIKASGGVFQLSMARWPGTGFVMPGDSGDAASLETMCENAFEVTR